MFVFSSTLNQLLDRRGALINKADRRRKLLEDSYRYQQFDQDADEVEAWIREKLKGTSDESYKVLISYSFQQSILSRT